MTIQPWETNPAAVAYEFMTAGGINSPEMVDDLIGNHSAADAAALFAQEAEDHWVLHVSPSDLEAAIADFIVNRPDRVAA